MVDLSKATNPLPAYARFCKASKLANNFASHIQDVLGKFEISPLNLALSQRLLVTDVNRRCN